MNIDICKYAIDKQNIHCNKQGEAQINAFNGFIFKEVNSVFGPTEGFSSKGLSGGNH